MNNRATILKVDGTEQELDHRPTLTEAQRIVGGYIEFARGKRGGKTVRLVVNEDGLCKAKPFNSKATAIHDASARQPYPFPIVGDVIVLEGWRTVGNG